MRLPGHNSEATIRMLKNICDPLLSKNVDNWQLKKQKKEPKSIEHYDIPDDLKKHPKNFNRYIPLKEIISKTNNQTPLEPVLEPKSKDQILKEKVESKLREIEDKVRVQ